MEFGLRFEDETSEDIDTVEEIPESKMVIIEDDDENNVAEIVSLDSFRKNNYPFIVILLLSAYRKL